MPGYKKIVHLSFSGLLLQILLVLTQGCGAPQAVAPDENRLASSASPYLREHADNPVNWQEWGPEALAQAKRENKPLLISIGYTSCHWCHAMEQESFMDTAVARLMNSSFICIKVDREQRPDIDNLYLHACQLLNNGEAGWPLNAFALPDGRPFYAGTYFSKENWIKLLVQVKDNYNHKNSKVQLQAASLTYGIADNDSLQFGATGNPASFTRQTYRDLFSKLKPRFDFVAGGLKGSPKFPSAPLWNFIFQYAYLTGDGEALAVAENTLHKMALGGLYDQAGGGFSRYSTDSIWHIPHFEKMLYDNGQLVSLYAAAYQQTKKPFYRKILEKTLSFVDRELSSPQGGFFSSVNADSDGGEGAFYSWSLPEFNKAAGANARLLGAYYHISEPGNWEHGSNILFATETPEIFAASRNVNPAAFAMAAENLLRKLFEVRSHRSKPSADTKIITSWNAIMLKGYADAFAATGDSLYLRKALQTAAFLVKNLMTGEGKLFRNFNNGIASGDGFLDDYAWVADAFIRIYQLSFDKQWLLQAQQLTEYCLLHFYDAGRGSFYYGSSSGTVLAVQQKQVRDEAIPSSNAVMAKVLWELGVFFSREDYFLKSRNMLGVLSATVRATPEYYTQWCWLAGLAAYGSREVAVIGPSAASTSLALQRHYLPSSFFMVGTGKQDLPFLAGKGQPGKTVIYVCSGTACKQPVEGVQQAIEQINSGYGTSVLLPGTIINNIRPSSHFTMATGD